jgi:hypothetical protein
VQRRRSAAGTQKRLDFRAIDLSFPHHRMSPYAFLMCMVILTAGAAVAQMAARARHLGRLKRLAGEWKMHFSARDRFRLSPRVAEALPVPGAAGVRVFDLIYGIEQERHRYLFSTEYTVGVLRSKTGCRRVATFSEPRDAACAEKGCELIFASSNLPLIEQYQELWGQVSKMRQE